MATNKIHTFRNILVIISTLLMIAVVVFQCLEISEYNIWDHIKTTLQEQFQPEPAPPPPASASAEVQPAAAPQADAPAEPGE